MHKMSPKISFPSFFSSLIPYINKNGTSLNLQLLFLPLSPVPSIIFIFVIILTDTINPLPQYSFLIFPTSSIIPL